MGDCQSNVGLLLLIFLIITMTQAITITQEEVKTVYPAQVHSERDLSMCSPNEVCSVIHRRFWIRPVIDRLCRCPIGQQCPSTWTWANETDDQTMALSNRSQMKFCGSTATLPECEPEQDAVVIAPRVDSDRKPGSRNKTDTPPREFVNVTCRCQERRYWEYHSNNDTNGTTVDTSRIYRCTEVTKCHPMRFCGNVRSDYFTTYYRCSCPVGFMCLFKDRTIHNVSELLFDGPAYKAFCLPNGVPEMP